MFAYRSKCLRMAPLGLSCDRERLGVRGAVVRAEQPAVQVGQRRHGGGRDGAAVLLDGRGAERQLLPVDRLGAGGGEGGVDDPHGGGDDLGPDAVAEHHAEAVRRAGMTPLGRRRGDGGLVQDEPGADVDELADAGRGQLPAVAAGAGAAERHPDVGGDDGVDEDGARADPAGDGDPPLGVGRPDARAEAEAGVVGDPDGLVVPVGDDHRGHRAEDLLVVGDLTGRDVGQHRRRVEVARPAPAAAHRRAAGHPSRPTPRPAGGRPRAGPPGPSARRRCRPPRGPRPAAPTPPRPAAG